MGTEITVIDDSDYVGFFASAVREGEIYMTDVKSMVANIFAALRIYSRTCNPSAAMKYNKMSRLNILDHGNEDGIEIGSDWIDVSTLATYKPDLALLAGNFESNGFVHLQHCSVGQNRTLLLSLAKVFGVKVYAGTSYQNPLYRINFGHYVSASPDGSFNSNAGRP